MAIIQAVDLFCGVGGLTVGLESAGISVVEGYDIDPECKFPYEANSSAKYNLKNVRDVEPRDIEAALAGAEIKVMVGCAPCQPFSTYTQGLDLDESSRWKLVKHFADLVAGAKPDIVSMENVRKLASHPAFKHFQKVLEREGYWVTYQHVDCRLYGVPQKRTRLVLLASKLGPIELIAPTHPKQSDWNTVQKTIWHLPPLGAGEQDDSDKLHVSSSLSDLNLRRIRASKPGGTWRDWPENLVANCHKKQSGKTFPGVYARMEHDKPSPTMTGQCFGYGNGRFGHPQQDRAISLREAALLQTFPPTFEFVEEAKPVRMKSVGRMIGNAVPPRLGEVIGKSIIQHLIENPRPAIAS